jgi:rod shape-determining protein MreC
LAAFHSDTRPILGRGPSILLRFVFFALLAIGLMWVDQRHRWLESVRYGISWAAYPFQALVSSPGTAWDWLTESFSTRERLQRENSELQARLREADLRMMRFEALEQENIRLRAMREATANIAERAMVAEIMRVDLNPFRHRVILNKGARNGVFKGQPLLDAKGVFGQITRAGPFSAEAILISDSEHAIPVQVNRNGLRTIAVGTGDLSRLSLPFLPINADIRTGDLLVTSGLDEIFPAGYPVAVVTEVDQSPGQTLATISARPAAALDRDREVLLVWVKEKLIEPVAAPAGPPGVTPGRAATQAPAPPQSPSRTTGTPPGTDAGTRAGTTTQPAQQTQRPAATAQQQQRPAAAAQPTQQPQRPATRPETPPPASSPAPDVGPEAPPAQETQADGPVEDTTSEQAIPPPGEEPAEQAAPPPGEVPPQ